MTLEATLGGVPLTLDGAGAFWTLKNGVYPNEQTFVSTASRIADIVKRASSQFADQPSADITTRTRGKGPTRSGPLELVVKSTGYPTLRVQGLYILQTVAVDESRAGVVVADRRWLFSRQHIAREYNVRKRSGDFRLVGGAKAPLALFDANPDLVFRRVTTNNGRRWTALEVLEDILSELVGTNGFEIGNLPLRNRINDLMLDDSGESALARVVAYLPGAEIYCDNDGRIKVYNSLDGSEKAAFESAGTPFPDSQVALIDRSFIRPQRVTSLFEQEIEMRLDYDEEDQKPAGTTRERGANPRPPRTIQNVIQVTDPRLTLNGETVERGTWLVFEDWLTAVENENDFNTRLGALDLPLIRKWYNSGLGWLRAAMVRWHTGDVDLLWDQRLTAVLNHWRRTFRILPEQMDLYRGIVAARVAILDTETGTRGKAEAYFDHAKQPTLRAVTKGGGEIDQDGWQVAGYQADITGDGATARPGPADVVVLDEQNGIFQLQFRADPLGNTAKIAPGLLVGDLPRVRAEFIPRLWELMELRAEWRLAVILTVSLASPNDTGRMHAESVDLHEALQLLPGVTSIGKARGPEWFIKVGAAIETARFGWLDSRSAEIEGAIYDGTPLPRDLLVDDSFVREVALANAARIQSFLLDRHEGQVTVSMNPSVKPTGSLAAVVHGVLPGSEGAVTTTLVMPPITTPPDVFSMLPDSARKVLLREVQP